MNIVIMAGGGGTRLWPLSRVSQPKQFLDLGSGKTLIEHAYDRARQLTQTEKIFVATTNQHVSRVRELLPEIKENNIFIEPAKRDTAPAFAAAASQLVERGEGEQPTMFMWSDHLFTAEAELITTLKRVPDLLARHPDSIIIIGHQATSPETVFGYIEVGEPQVDEPHVFTVKAFKEKPDKDTAIQYVAAGNYFWNMAYISARPQYLLDELRQYEPTLMQGIDQHAAAHRAGNAAEAERIYSNLPATAIDYALLERTPRLFMITGDFGWSDVGNWRAVRDLFGSHGDYGPADQHVHVDSDNNYIYNATGRTACLIGVKDLIVVITEDAILVTHQDQSHKVKDVVTELEKKENTRKVL